MELRNLCLWGENIIEKILGHSFLPGKCGSGFLLSMNKLPFLAVTKFPGKEVHYRQESGLCYVMTKWGNSADQ